MRTTQVKSGLGGSRELILDELAKLNIQQPWEAFTQLRQCLRELHGHSQGPGCREGAHCRVRWSSESWVARTGALRKWLTSSYSHWSAFVRSGDGLSRYSHAGPGHSGLFEKGVKLGVGEGLGRPMDRTSKGFGRRALHWVDPTPHWGD